MKCHEIMHPVSQRVRPEDTADQAAKLMEIYNVGLLPVCREDGGVLGVITDRDIAVRVVAQNRSAGQTPVREIMSSPAEGVAGEGPSELASELMSKRGFTRLLVLDQAGNVEGLVSIFDLVAEDSPDLALTVARSIRAREQTQGTPVRRLVPDEKASASAEQPGHGKAGGYGDDGVDNQARTEAERVVSGVGNALKEFPS